MHCQWSVDQSSEKSLCCCCSLKSRTANPIPACPLYSQRSRPIVVVPGPVPMILPTPKQRELVHFVFVVSLGYRYRISSVLSTGGRVVHSGNRHSGQCIFRMAFFHRTGGIHSASDFSNLKQARHAHLSSFLSALSASICRHNAESSTSL